MDRPLVSVIMGIYNCADTLSEAIKCILDQTYEHWELIMCDDGSTDNTYEIALKFARLYPLKIKLLKNEVNLGLNATLNKCLNIANGKYIARMDGDDLCDKKRFEKEVEFLENNSGFSIVSSNMKYFDSEGVFGVSSSKKEPDKNDIVKGTPFCHAPCMVRKEAYNDVGGYSVGKRLLRAEDYHLWIKMYAKGYKGYNIQEALYSMRDDRNAVKRRKFIYRINESYIKILAVRMLNLQKWKYIYALKPIIIGMTPEFVYNILHKKRLKSNQR